MKTFTTAIAPAACFAIALLAACSGDSSQSREHEEEEKRSAQASIKPTGTVVNVNMITDSKGERYDPVEVRVSRGDTLQFTLRSGVHNIHFLAAKNPAGAKLPPMSEYLQLPGQKKSVFVDFPEGHYYYQCDIHVLIGMVGHVTVEDDSPGDAR